MEWRRTSSTLNVSRNLDTVIFMNISEIEIRKMTEKDLDEVQILLEQLNESFNSEHDISIEALTSSFQIMRTQNDNYLNYIAVFGDKIVGFITVIIYLTFFHCKGTLLINELVVDKKYRGMKIGEKLLQHMIDIAKDRGLNEIEVGTTFENKDAIRFYKKNGLTDESIILGKELNC